MMVSMNSKKNWIQAAKNDRSEWLIIIEIRNSNKNKAKHDMH